MAFEYDSKPAIRKMGDDCYELIWNVNSMVLSEMTEEQALDLIEALQAMTTAPPWRSGRLLLPGHAPSHHRLTLNKSLFLWRVRKVKLIFGQ